jgi:phenylacetic acid degradation operon negative regulatory protein
MRGEELLTLLLYGLDIAMRPSFSRMLRGGERWQYYHGLHKSQLYKLRRNGLVERRGQSGHWALALTRDGRLRALGGRDPVECWDRPWDGEWRMLMFDLESGNETLRHRVLRWLHASHFGCLQKSVWLRPDPCPEFDGMLDRCGAPAASVLLFAGRPASRRVSDTSVAQDAWDFSAIGARYKAYLDFARSSLPKRPTPSGAQLWARTETSLWKAAIQRDPLLPNALLPANYLGKKAWSARRKLLRSAAALTVALDSSED